MEAINQSQKKTWQDPELTLISQGYVNGGGPNNGFKEHGHNVAKTKYYVQTPGGAPIPVGKAGYDLYVS